MEQRANELLIDERNRAKDLVIAQENRVKDERMADDAQKENILFEYTNFLAQLLAKDGMTLNGTSSSRFVARFKTLAVLLQLNPNRKSFLIKSLYEANLISGSPTDQLSSEAVIRLDSADLTGLDLGLPEGKPKVEKTTAPAFRWLLFVCYIFIINSVINSVKNIASLPSGEYDALVIIATNLDEVRQNIDDESIISNLQSYRELNHNFDNEITLIINGNVQFKRIIYSPTGLTNQDYDDVRRFADAGLAGVKKAKSTGAKSPLLACFTSGQYPKAKLVTLLAALEATYIPLQVREHTPEAQNNLNRLGFLVDRALPHNDDNYENLIAYARAIELGRAVGRDIGGADPERMTPPRVAEYVQALFAGSSNVTVNIIEGQERFVKEFPLFAAVNRAANSVARHQGWIIELEYKPSEGEIDRTLLFVGKGITYDTGGLDIKAGGHMAGMSYDKCGAANVAGFFKVLSEIKPRGLKVIGMLAVARNSCGEEGYVADEILTTRAGIRIRVGNTDAEGRMVMADPLCYLRELAVNEINPHLFTVATLTGHVIRAYGESYTAVIDNGPARKKHKAEELQEVGEKVGDPFEISTVRREDFDFILDKGEVAEVLQCNDKASSDTPRGHQFPAAFLAKVSGLVKYNIKAKEPLLYTHLDIAGSAGELPRSPTGRPIAALCEMFLAGRIF
ncbi:unnamed protein product [Adineta steineri]|uniref:Cytosol aminopeptidase domain-containing protein n=1 Tax=Adineta steineri TaxID=433720 RepID=A0A819THR5_9BILA|nr:unnamed protein product [Adineta steineri]CAF4079375.1 unnamed protein product [Adineta steineri]